jgi:hypothetical protein
MRAGASEIGSHFTGAIMAQDQKIDNRHIPVLPAEAARLSPRLPFERRLSFG